MLLRTSSSGLRLRHQDVLYRSHNATRLRVERALELISTNSTLVHVFLLPHLPHIPASMVKTPRKKDKVPFQQDKSPMCRFFRKVSKEEAQKAADDIMDAAAKEDNTPENKKKRSLARTAANWEKQQKQRKSHKKQTKFVCFFIGFNVATSNDIR